MAIKNIILQATGSIEKSTLKLIRKRKKSLIIGISAYEKTEELKLISEEFDVKNVSFKNDLDIKFNKKVKVLNGQKVFLN